MFDFNSIYLFYILIGLSAAMFAEGVYLLVYNNASYRKNINRRLKVMSDKSDRESVLVQLRRERGLTSSGEYRLPIVSLNRLLLQSGLTMGFASSWSLRQQHSPAFSCLKAAYFTPSLPRYFAASSCRRLP